MHNYKLCIDVSVSTSTCNCFILDLGYQQTLDTYVPLSDTGPEGGPQRYS